LRRYPARYAETVKDYCPDPTPAGQAVGLDVPTANAEVERLSADWPAVPTPAQRRHLAAVERHVGDGLNDELVAGLDKVKDRLNETSLIAARLGLERLWSVDDHSADPVDPAEKKASEEAIAHAWDNPATHARQAEDQRLQEGLAQRDGILAMFRAYNAPDAAMTVYQSDFGAAFLEPSPKGYGRNYLGYWETRNLRMVANIRDVLGQHPGTRLLAMVGVAHKGYYEAYLNQMHDVNLVDAERMLK
jgi:hypothetical protein